MRQPKPYIVEHKNRRTGSPRKPASSIWGNLDLGKALKDASDDAILDAMAADPILIERPLVETDKGVRLGRPPEKVREIL